MVFEIKVKKLGNSIGVLIPSHLVKTEGITTGDVVEVRLIKREEKTCATCRLSRVCRIREAILTGGTAGAGSEEMIKRAMNRNCDLYEAKE